MDLKEKNNVIEETCVAGISAAYDGTVYMIPDNLEIEAEFRDISRQAKAHRLKGRRIVVVQGLGFVGVAVAAAIAEAVGSLGEALHFVIGVDLPTSSGYWKVAKLREGLSPVSSPDPELTRLIHKASIQTRNLRTSVSPKSYSLADVIMVDVPLDVHNRVSENGTDITIGLDAFKESIRVVGRYMRSDALVIIETTVPIGTCEKVVLPILREERANRGIKEPVLLAHAYERVMPGVNYVDSIRRFWRNFAGIDSRSSEKAREFMSSFIDTASYPLRELEDTASCELGKLLENSYRAANIAFIYEWTILAEKIGVNLFDIIDSIRVRKGTHDNMRFPGFGVGGYCLTKDPLLAQWSALNFFDTDITLRMTLDAVNINYKMPLHTLDLLNELSPTGLSGKNILVCGLSYLPEVSDFRNSPTKLLVEKLMEAGAKVTLHDPHVKIWNDKPDISITENLSDCLKNAAGIVFAVPHKKYLDTDLVSILDGRKPPMPFIVDSQNIISDEKAEALHNAGCRLSGVGKGHWRKRGYQWAK